MIKDYHLHPQILQKPEVFRDFVNRAAELGIGEICVTDHMPLSINDAGDRIPKGHVRDYCRRVRELAKEYDSVLSIKCGIEIDYHPDFTDEIHAVLSEGEFDIILASSHMHIYCEKRIREGLTHNEFADIALRNTLSAAKTGLFTTIAHLDMYRWVFGIPERYPLTDDGFDIKNHEPLIDEILNEISAKGMYLEINPHLAENKNNIEYVYPQTEIAEKALRKNIRFCYGSDAHNPSSVGVLLNELRSHPLYGKALNIWESD